MAKISPEITEQIVIEYQEGNSSVVLARRYGVQPSTIMEALRRKGVQARRQGWVKNTSGDFRTQRDIEEAVIAADTRPHGAKHIPELDYRLTREERARRSLASYFNNEEGRR